MTQKFCKPFKSCTPQKLAQGFHSEHKANDYWSFYGDWLVAPFNCKIIVIRGPQNGTDKLDTDDIYLRGGCGVRMQSTEDPTLSAAYWHTLPFFPVSVGDLVLQGQPVAQEGNTGFVISGGKVVEYDIRLKPPFPGTHVHYTAGYNKVDGTYEALDPSKLIDWSIPVNFNTMQAIQNVFNKITSFLKAIK